VCVDGRIPKTRTDYWSSKLKANVKRDIKTRKALEKLGWKTLVVWECELADTIQLSRRISDFLGG
jgi:DNA mismatch endonuclease (patch repair protein)